jgi:hypothetical protein
MNKLRDRLNPDCFLILQEYIKETITIHIKLDLETHQKRVYYAYPFHPFVWRLMDVAPEKACNRWYFFIYHIIESHNEKRQYPVKTPMTKTLMEDIRQFLQLFYERFLKEDGEKRSLDLNCGDKVGIISINQMDCFEGRLVSGYI